MTLSRPQPKIPGKNSTQISHGKNDPPLAPSLIEDLLILLYGNLSDEAASHLLIFLSDLAQYLKKARSRQIRKPRSRKANPTYPTPKPRQLVLFPDLPSP